MTDPTSSTTPPQSPPPAESGSRRPVLSTRKKWLFRVVLVSFSLGFSLVCAEVALRVVDGYRLGSIELQRRPIRPGDVTLSPAVQDYATTYVAAGHGASSIDPTWIVSTPEAPPRPDVPADVEARHERSLHLNYVWNDVLFERYMPVPGGPVEDLRALLPAEFFLFPAPQGVPHPRYRFPANASLPTGLVTDRFGFRCRHERTFVKPPKTVRIFCVGASTTVSNHRYAFSYPELVEHWFSLWVERQGLDVQIEVWNAGREGIDSRDIAEIVETEILPLDPDLIFYYEGSNQFDPGTIIRWDTAVAARGQPPESLLSESDQELATRDGPTGLWRFSAVYRRIIGLVDSYFAPEIPKPQNTWQLPDGLTEFEPDLSKIGDALNLGQILQDLDRCRLVADSTGATFVMSSFCWLVEDGMLLNRGTRRGIWVYLNKAFYPFTYSNLRRAADLQNRVYETWASVRDVPFVPVADEMPMDQSWFLDAIHVTEEGVRIRGWIVFNHLVPMVEAKLRTGEWPRPAKAKEGERHPHLRPEKVTTRAWDADRDPK